MEVTELFNVNLSPTTSSIFSTTWSEDDRIFVITENGLHVLRESPRDGTKPPQMKRRHFLDVRKTALCFCVLLAMAPLSSASNITSSVFGSVTDGMPAAFADYNSDDYIDLFVLRDGGQTLQVMLASDQEPFLKPHPGMRCHFPPRLQITSVVPGNYDGDAHMDVLVTTFDKESNNGTQVHILWGGRDYTNCTADEIPTILSLNGQPLAIDYNRDAIVDIFGVDNNGKRTFWVFNENRTAPTTILMTAEGKNLPNLRQPHSNSFLDVNEDIAPDLVLATQDGFELWYGEKEGGFIYNKTTDAPKASHLGQSLFVDLELKGELQHLVPVCFDDICANSTIFVYSGGRWRNLNPILRDSLSTTWGFVAPNNQRYTKTITVRAGDFNMDGYPDLLATLQQVGSSKPRAYLLENIACPTTGSCDGMERTFSVDWATLTPLNNDSTVGVFYDVYQDGVLDVILAGERVTAFRNTLDYDANFVKVMVLVGPHKLSNFPGPRITYNTTTQEGDPRSAVATQLPQSAHFSLGLPYTTFGLGRTPNFVDTLVVGAAGHSREWTQIIPNSQMVAILSPLEEPGRWRARLFVTPSKLILLSAAALTGTCGLITALVAGLYWKERREDRIEKLQEAHRFHFDAM
uniref:T-cell immunomodulatory protein TIP C2 domain-containing protein n=1 Tax=Timema douglasi TaxID=61478 RepID=A0A7R8VXS3_TIMDO|nr:unnamed protein product [Timema douglasi]